MNFKWLALPLVAGAAALLSGCNANQVKPMTTSNGPLKPALTADQKIDQLRKANMSEGQRKFLEDQVRSGQDRR